MIYNGKFESVFIPFPRETEAGDIRITESGDSRVTESSSENTAVGSIVAVGNRISFNSELYVKYLTHWKIATPYVKDNNIWKIPNRVYRFMNNAWKRIN